MSPPLAGLPGHPPALWRAGGPRSLAAELWGADFELHADDCPLAPGPWKDRVGGKIVTCVGSGDWDKNANGYAGVTKSDVCYGEFGEDVAQKILGQSFDATDWRTIAVIAEVDTSTAIQPIAHGNYTGPNNTCELAKRRTSSSHAAYYLTRTNTTGGTFTTFARPRATAGTRILIAASARQHNTAYQLRSASNDAVWSAVNGTLFQTGTFASGFLFRRGLYSSLTITNATTRNLRIKSLAAGPGTVDPLLLRDWFLAEGGTWVLP